jgi:hypothetical protein
VPFESFLKSNCTGTGYFKALLCAGVGFNLWHYLKFNFYTLAGVSELTKNLWSHVGNMFYKKTVKPKTQNAKRGAKVINYFKMTQGL